MEHWLCLHAGGCTGKMSNMLKYDSFTWDLQLKHVLALRRKKEHRLNHHVAITTEDSEIKAQALVKTRKRETTMLRFQVKQCARFAIFKWTRSIWFIAKPHQSQCEKWNGPFIALSTSYLTVALMRWQAATTLQSHWKTLPWLQKSKSKSPFENTPPNPTLPDYMWNTTDQAEN